MAGAKIKISIKTQKTLKTLSFRNTILTRNMLSPTNSYRCLLYKLLFFCIYLQVKIFWLFSSATLLRFPIGSSLFDELSGWFVWLAKLLYNPSPWVEWCCYSWCRPWPPDTCRLATKGRTLFCKIEWRNQ